MYLIYTLNLDYFCVGADLAMHNISAGTMIALLKTCPSRLCKPEMDLHCKNFLCLKLQSRATTNQSDCQP